MEKLKQQGRKDTKCSKSVLFPWLSYMKKWEKGQRNCGSVVHPIETKKATAKNF